MSAEQPRSADDALSSARRRLRAATLGAAAALTLILGGLIAEFAAPRFDVLAQARPDPLAQRLSELADTAAREARALATLERAIQQHALEQANRRGFSPSGNGWRLQRDGGAVIEIDTAAVSMVVPGGGQLRVDASGAQLFGPIVVFGTNDGIPLARVTDVVTNEMVPLGPDGALIPMSSTIVTGASLVLVGE